MHYDAGAVITPEKSTLSLPESCKTIINAAAARFGARVVGAQWGPRGVGEVLARINARGFAPALVFDIGAANGQWTRDCRKIFADARYVLVDPLERNRAALLELARDARIEVFYGVAGPRAGVVQVYEHGDQSSILPSVDFPGELCTVAATTVDALFDAAGTPSPVLLKADVQGFELEVLRGAARCLASSEVLILEVSFRRVYKDSALAHEVIGYLGDRGFRIYEICSYLQRSTDRDLLQSDFVFVHESSSLFSHHGWT
jgi:FkbM family methyltransferase